MWVFERGFRGAAWGSIKACMRRATPVTAIGPGGVRMTIETIALFVAGTLLGTAVLVGRQVTLMAAVLAYAGVVGWIIQRDLDLLAPALVVAIVFGFVGLGRVVYRVILSQDDTESRNLRKLTTSNRVMIQNMGS